VAAAAVLSGIFALFMLVGGLMGLGTPSAVGIILVIAAVFIALAWVLWQGRQSGRAAAITVGVFMIFVGLLVASTMPSRVLYIGIGAAFVALLTIPASARAYFAGQRRPVVG
jgi:predicted branched-subunit amino acid permease